MAKVRLLLLAIGPVQGLIAAGRRCQDLWSGSQLLSDVAGAIASALNRECGNKAMVFPASGLFAGAKIKKGRSVANKILVDVSNIDQDISHLARQALQAGYDFLETEISEKIQAIPSHELFVDLELARRQILGGAGETGMLEAFWVVLEGEKADGSDYAQTREAADRLLAARKNSRLWSAFAVPSAAASRSKSSIDGTREAVVLAPGRDADDDTVEAFEQFCDALRMRPGEVLAGPDLLKRARQVPIKLKASTADPGNEPDDLPDIHSTSHMAATPLLVKLSGENRTALRAALDEYFSSLKEQLRKSGIDKGQPKRRFFSELAISPSGARTQTPDAGSKAGPGIARKVVKDHEVLRDFMHRPNGRAAIDGSVFFPGRVTDLFTVTTRRFTKAGKLVTRAEVLKSFEAEAQKALRACLRAFDVGEQPTPYYAVLCADGDRMGERLEKIATLDGHRAFSRALEDGFASQCETLVADHGGSLIYAGGDDVLALVPLHTALQVSLALRKLFLDAMETTSLAVSDRPTLSVGLAFVHHLTPLDKAIDLARAAEGLAKRGFDNGDQRDALAIIMDKRSGTTVKVTGEWWRTPSIADRIQTWIKALQGGYLPDGVAFELEDICRPFALQMKSEDDPQDTADPTVDEALQRLAARVIGRKKDAHRKALSAELQRQLLDRIAGGGMRAVRHLSHELQIARLIASALKDAGMRLEVTHG